MKKKSKFIIFLLSFLPGLSHFYIGYADRGLIYLIIFGGLCVGTIGLGMITGAEEVLIIIGLAGPMIWLLALMDSFSIINSMGHSSDGLKIENTWNSEETKLSNKKAISLALSIIPGAGHMYLGYQQKGLVLMGGFFFTIFFMGWLGLSLLLFILPLIWFYSFFDAFHIINGNNVEDIDVTKIIPIIKPNYIGIGLIGIGLLTTFQNIFFPMISRYIGYEIRNYIQTGVVSLIFIIGGIKILGKKREIEYIREEVEDEK